MSTERLELMLHEVAGEIDYPPTPDLSFRVAHRLTRDPLAPELKRHPSRRTGLNLRPALVVAIVVVMIGFFTLAFSPTARRAVADLLGVLGIQISVTDEIDSPEPRRDAPLTLGRRTSVPAAYGAVGFTAKAPSMQAVDGMSAAVYIDRSIGESGMLSLVYPRDAGTYADIELLITQFQASVDETFMKKSLAGGSEVRFVDVRGTTGFWLTGESHTFIYLESDGDTREETARLAGNVLLWEEAGITYRIEGPATLAEAQRIAISLR